MSLALRNFETRSALSDPDEPPHSAPLGSRADPSMGEPQVSAPVRQRGRLSVHLCGARVLAPAACADTDMHS